MFDYIVYHRGTGTYVMLSECELYLFDTSNVYDADYLVTMIDAGNVRMVPIMGDMSGNDAIKRLEDRDA